MVPSKKTISGTVSLVTGTATESARLQAAKGIAASKARHKDKFKMGAVDRSLPKGDGQSAG
jgi:hypothetical protein